MGLGLFSSCSESRTVSDKPSAPAVLVQPSIFLGEPKAPADPKPSNFHVRRAEERGRYLIVLVQYPNATNYNGYKLLLYRGVSAETLLQQKLLDPHFDENECSISPIARFEPTAQGWAMAEALCRVGE